MKQTIFPIRYKFLLTFSMLALVSLGIFAYIAGEFFRRDKVSYVFDSSLQQARNASRSLGAELNSKFEVLKTLAQGTDLVNQKLTQTSEFILKERADFRQFAVVSVSAVETKLLIQAEPKRDTLKIDLLTMVPIRSTESIYVKILNPDDGSLILAIRGDDTKNQRALWSIALVKSDELLNLLSNPVNRGLLIVDSEQGKIFGETDTLPANLSGDILTWAGNLISGESTKFFTAKNDRFLSSASATQFGKIMVVSIIKESVAFAALTKLTHFSIYFALALFSAFVLVSWMSSRKMTSSLTKLSNATEQLAQGNFAMRVDVTSKDEVGILSNGFNLMATEVQRLLVETVEKGRMEAELKTAQTVQNTLFPATSAELNGVSIRGHYESASECGGDWWHYHRNGDKVFVWIGDATGHGAPAALITSAARAAASLVEWQPDITPGQALRILNRAIYATSRGGMMMTFFIGCFDLAKKTFSYSNASHNPPFHITQPKRNSSLSKADFNPLVEANNPRLGQSLDHFFTEFTIPIEDEDYVILFTDGVTEMKNNEGKDFGERKFIKSLCSAFSEGKGIDDVLKMSIDAVYEHKLKAALTDDVTYIVCSFDSRLNEVKAS